MMKKAILQVTEPMRVYSFTFLPEDGSKPILVDGKYMSIFQKQSDGSWKLYQDIFNSNTG